MFDVSLRPGKPLTGGVDLEAIVAGIPASYTVKGMFCSRFTEKLGSEWAQLAPRLSAPPRGGRYLPFKDYPQSDYTRIVVAAASKQFPDLALPEAVRRLARDDLATFSTSVFGRILLTLSGDAHSTLLHLPDAWARIAPGPSVWTEELDPACTRLVFARYRGIPEYTLGQIEGIVLTFAHTPVVTVRRLDDDTLAFDVVHGCY